MKKFSTIIVLFFCALFGFAQDPGFSQYYAVPMFINPAFIGDKQDMSFGVNTRTYTNKLLAKYNLTQISGIVPFNADFLYKSSSETNHSSGAGITVYREATGTHNELNSFAALVSLGHCIQIERQHFLSFGMQSGYVRKTQGDNFSWGSQYSEDFGYDPSIPSSINDALQPYSHFPTFGIGLEYFFNSGVLEDYSKAFDFDAYTGIAVYNVNRPNQSFLKNAESRLPLIIKYNGGIKYRVNKRFALFPTILWEHQNLNNQVNIGMYANIRTVLTEAINKKAVNIIAGTWYRVGDSFIATLGFTVYDFKCAISYDFNATKFKYNSKGKGATEVSLKYIVETQGKRERYSRGLLYPSF